MSTQEHDLFAQALSENHAEYADYSSTSPLGASRVLDLLDELDTTDYTTDGLEAEARYWRKIAVVALGCSKAADASAARVRGGGRP